jgi:hypothetical protein
LVRATAREERDTVQVETFERTRPAPQFDEFDLDVRLARRPNVSAVTPHTECDAAECQATDGGNTCEGTCFGGGNTCDGTCPGDGNTCDGTCSGNTCEGTCQGNTCEATCDGGNTCTEPNCPEILTDVC